MYILHGDSLMFSKGKKLDVELPDHIIRTYTHAVAYSARGSPMRMQAVRVRAHNGAYKLRHCKVRKFVEFSGYH